jgi:hypothetical protein
MIRLINGDCKSLMTRGERHCCFGSTVQYRVQLSFLFRQNVGVGISGAA